MFLCEVLKNKTLKDRANEHINATQHTGLISFAVMSTYDHAINFTSTGICTEKELRIPGACTILTLDHHLI